MNNQDLINKKELTGKDIQELLANFVNTFGEKKIKKFIPSLITTRYKWFNYYIYEDTSGFYSIINDKKIILINPFYNSFEDLAQKITNMDITLKMIELDLLDSMD